MDTDLLQLEVKISKVSNLSVSNCMLLVADSHSESQCVIYSPFPFVVIRCTDPNIHGILRFTKHGSVLDKVPPGDETKHSHDGASPLTQTDARNLLKAAAMSLNSGHAAEFGATVLSSRPSLRVRGATFQRNLSPADVLFLCPDNSQFGDAAFQFPLLFNGDISTICGGVPHPARAAGGISRQLLKSFDGFDRGHPEVKHKRLSRSYKHLLDNGEPQTRYGQ
ncbi:hypothetical protein LSH36_154g06007 [Paralvinella palmiformis]|uniref:Uncharacterized protein n=1 Tax=Paralvinella palmiformis TaxID=53620 RepID=A0AAD9JU66_9ANNE|nr:hypothetical protein LSH36_154g06007 [Paralvinella palmiformis]